MDMDFTSQRLYDAQRYSQLHRGFTRLQLHDKAHTHPCRHGLNGCG